MTAITMTTINVVLFFLGGRGGGTGEGTGNSCTGPGSGGIVKSWAISPPGAHQKMGNLTASIIAEN
jgi:hypothetical protein